MILDEDKDLGLLDYIAEICNKFLAFAGELSGRFGKRSRGKRRIQSNIYLFVLHRLVSLFVNKSIVRANLRMGLCHLQRLLVGEIQN